MKSNYIILLKSRNYDVLELCDFLNDQRLKSYAILGDYEVIAEFNGEYEALRVILRSDYIRKKVFLTRSRKRPPIVVFKLERQLPDFREERQIKCYTFVTFEQGDEIDIGIARLENETDIGCVRTHSLASHIMVPLPHVVMKHDSENISSVKDLLLNRVANISKKYKLELRTTTFLIL